MSLAILNNVLDGIEVVAEIIPYAQLFIKTCKNIYDRCQEPSRLRAEIQDFLHFLKIIETSIINTNLSNNTTGASANLLKFVEISCLNVIDINNMV